MKDILKLIEANLAAIVMGAVLAFQSFTANATKTSETLTKIEERLGQIEASQKQLPCIIRQIDRLNNGGAGAIPCNLNGQ